LRHGAAPKRRRHSDLRKRLGHTGLDVRVHRPIQPGDFGSPGDRRHSAVALRNHDLAGNAADPLAARLKAGSTTTIPPSARPLLEHNKRSCLAPSSVIGVCPRCDGSLIFDASSQFTGTIAPIAASRLTN
jgi:hypothetical protein